MPSAVTTKPSPITGCCSASPSGPLGQVDRSVISDKVGTLDYSSRYLLEEDLTRCYETAQQDLFKARQDKRLCQCRRQGDSQVKLLV